MTTRHPRPCGRVISLDRGYPLVRVGDEELRAQHAIDLVKNADARAVVGDIVDLEFPPTQDIPLITRIHERAHTLVRRSLVESRSVGSGKHDEQILATNIDVVFVVTSLSGRRLDLDYLERQLVMAHESGAEVCVLLTKADQAAHRSEDEAASRACNPGGSVILTSKITGEGFAQLKELLQGSGDVLSGSGGALLGRSGALQGGDGMLPGRSGVLLGRSGVGKSTLINRLCGSELLQTAAVR
ncbi:MAG: GTPase RsgA, partial [Coriobacteriales bacterium]|nr:GTPase RsgA [Coriobacteriales bacterium]